MSNEAFRLTPGGRRFLKMCSGDDPFDWWTWFFKDDCSSERVRRDGRFLKASPGYLCEVFDE